MKKFLKYSLMTIIMSVSILGCGQATGTGGAANGSSETTVSTAQSSTSDDSATDSSTQQVSFESARCLVTEVTDDLVILKGIDEDINYQTPISNLIGEDAINPEEEYLISYFLDNKKEVSENTYYIEKCELISKTVLNSIEIDGD